jgi:hypothetical protein
MKIYVAFSSSPQMHLRVHQTTKSEATPLHKLGRRNAENNSDGRKNFQEVNAKRGKSGSSATSNAESTNSSRTEGENRRTSRRIWTREDNGQVVQKLISRYADGHRTVSPKRLMHAFQMCTNDGLRNEAWALYVVSLQAEGVSLQPADAASQAARSGDGNKRELSLYNAALLSILGDKKSRERAKQVIHVHLCSHRMD